MSIQDHFSANSSTREVASTAAESGARGAAEVSVRGFIANIQALRAIAALLVIYAHLETSLKVLGIPKFGLAGVDIFFVISGYIMVNTTAHRPVTPLRFIAERLARIAPPYWFITLLVFVAAYYAPSLFQSTSADLASLVTSLLFIPHARADGSLTPLLFVGWTLNYEMLFYSVFALGLFFPKRNVTLVSTVLALTVMAGFIFRPDSKLAEFYTSTRLLEFLLGMLIAHFVKDGDRLLEVLRSKVAWGLLAAAALILCVGLQTAFPQSDPVLASGPAAAILLISILALERLSIKFDGPIMMALGNASYAIYLTHPFVTQALQKVAGPWLDNKPVALLVLIAAPVATGVVGVVFHRVVETPLTTAARHLVKRWT